MRVYGTSKKPPEANNVVKATCKLQEEVVVHVGCLVSVFFHLRSRI